MAINLETQYPGKVAPSTPSYPYGAARNITVPGDGTGTPWEAAIVNDLVGFQQALLSDAGVVPSGTPDKVGGSQYLQALAKSSGLVREDYAGIRAVVSTLLSDETLCFISDAGVAGNFVLDKTDVATADDGGTVIVATDGARWKRLQFGTFFAKWFETAEDGVTDDTANFQKALDAFGATGGLLVIQGRLLADSDVTVKPNITVKGNREYVGSPQDNSSADYGALGSAIILNSAATLRLKGGSGFSGMLIHRKGLLFPEADSSAFAGTAITAENDDCFLVGSMVLGFSKAYFSTGHQRPRLNNNYIDCLSGIHVVNCLDISRIVDNQCWPFATIAGANPAGWWQRTGIGFLMQNIGDWNKLRGNFSFGYFSGTVIDGCNSVTVISGGADSNGGYAGQIGFKAIGSSVDTRFVFCQAAAQETGIYINTATAADQHNQVVGCDTWNNASHGLLIDGGDVSVNGGNYRDQPNGVSINNAASRVFIDSTRFKGITGNPINMAVASSLVFIGKNNDYGNLAAGTSPVGGLALTPQTVASADPLLLPASGDTFIVSGTVDFGSISGGWAGRKFTLIFLGALTVFDGVPIDLAGDFVTTANDVLELNHNGTNHFEVTRSVN